MDESFYDAFLSYASRDRVRVLRLQRELEQISRISS